MIDRVEGEVIFDFKIDMDFGLELRPESVRACVMGPELKRRYRGKQEGLLRGKKGGITRKRGM